MYLKIVPLENRACHHPKIIEWLMDDDIKIVCLVCNQVLIVEGI